MSLSLSEDAFLFYWIFSSILARIYSSVIGYYCKILFSVKILGVTIALKAIDSIMHKSTNTNEDEFLPIIFPLLVF